MARRLLFFSLLLAALAGCGHMPVSTIWALRSFDATTVDPAQLRAAIRIPNTLEPRPGGVTLNIGWRREGGEPHEAEFILKETTEPADLAPLAAEKRPGTSIHAFRVDPADIPKIKALQAEAIEEKARGGGRSHGSFGVGAEACRRGELAEGPLLMTTFLRTQPSGAYLTVLKDLDLRQAATKGKPLEALAPPCA